MGQGIEAQLGLVWIVGLTPIQLNICELDQYYTKQV
jgi:hypothetical protein